MGSWPRRQSQLTQELGDHQQWWGSLMSGWGDVPAERDWVRKSRSQHLAGKLTWPHSGGSWSFAFLLVSVAMWLIPENLQHNHLSGDHFRRYPQSCVGLWCGVCDLIICSCVLWSSAAEACGPSFLSSDVCSGSQVASSEPAQLYGALWGSPQA